MFGSTLMISIDNLNATDKNRHVESLVFSAAEQLQVSSIALGQVTKHAVSCLKGAIAEWASEDEVVFGVLGMRYQDIVNGELGHSEGLWSFRNEWRNLWELGVACHGRRSLRGDRGRGFASGRLSGLLDGGLTGTNLIGWCAGEVYVTHLSTMLSSGNAEHVIALKVKG